MTTPNRVLVIDDSWAVLDATRKHLTTEGYEVRVATDLPTAARHVRASDLCLVDFHMPGLDGKSILVALKAALDSEHRCVFYLYTSDPEAAKRAREYGFDGCFLKKADAAILGHQVAAVFRTLRMSKLGGSTPPASR